MGPKRTPRPALLSAQLMVCASLALGAPPAARGEWRIVDRGSPWSAKRPVRPHTRYIVLHTTEGAERGSLEKLARYGEAHYLVGLDGTVHRLVDRRRIATHAGRSMWEGHTNVDEHAIGIEVVGYHDKRPRRAQVIALKELIRQLQSLYDIPDRRVLTHSMVAYGAPNRWHRRRHRGRRRCGMRLAEPAVRRQLGLEDRPVRDPDVEAGRLAVADKDLFAFLFPARTGKPAARDRAEVLRRARAPESNVVRPGRSPWDIAKEAYDRPEVIYTFPDGRRFRGDEIRSWTRIPEGTKVGLSPSPESTEQGFEGFAIIGESGESPEAIAGDEYADPTTIYLFPSGLIRTGEQLAESERFRFLLEDAPQGTRLLVGYHYGGYVTGRRAPSVICGDRWNFPSTFYRLPDGAIASGDRVDPARIPRNTLVFFQR